MQPHSAAGLLSFGGCAWRPGFYYQQLYQDSGADAGRDNFHANKEVFVKLGIHGFDRSFFSSVTTHYILSKSLGRFQLQIFVLNGYYDEYEKNADQVSSKADYIRYRADDPLADWLSTEVVGSG